MHHKLQYIEAYNPDIEPYVIADYTAGFNKAMELNKDKVFTIEDCKKLMKSASYGWFEKDFDKHIQSLQQPTEIEVEIEMECCGNYSPPCNHNCEYGGKPKLDSEGCLILKRVTGPAN
jgi:hypothetical protein